MLLTLQRGGRLPLPPPLGFPRWLCLRCHFRLLHTAADEPLQDLQNRNVASQSQKRPRKKQGINHPRRAPRIYIDRPTRNTPLKSFAFLEARGSRPRPRDQTSDEQPSEQTQMQRQLEEDINKVAETIGLRPTIISSINNFLGSPFVPTQSQQTLLYSLHREKQHLFFRAETGTGKSFILAIHSLNLSRSMNEQNQPTTTALILVPNPELAMQYQYWITRILGSSIKDPTQMTKIVQAIFRTDKDGETRQEEALRESPNPHIIVSTPTRMLDLIAENGDMFDVDNLRYIILDEVDELLKPPAKVETNKIHHRTPGEILLDWIFQKRNVKPTQESVRLVAISATLTNSLRSFIIEKQWLGSEETISRGLPTLSSFYSTPKSIDHHVILASFRKSPDPTLQPDRVHIQHARLPVVTLHDNIRTRPPPLADREPPSSTEYPPNYLAISAMQRIIRETSTKKAVVIIPHGASIADFIWSCNYFGFTGVQELRFSLDRVADGFLETNFPRDDEPLVYVAHAKSIRGVDLRAIETVFILGEIGTLEDYVHITGLTSRRRKGGAVVTIIEDTLENVGQILTNVAIKLFRTGSKVGKWSLPPIEMDLKALPGDEFEEMRNKAGIVTVTEEVRKKQERERKTKEEMKKWLLSEGADEDEVGWITETETSGDKFERPKSFGMENSNGVKKEMETIQVEPPAIDWREALTQSLHNSSKESPMSSDDNVVFSGSGALEAVEGPEKDHETENMVSPSKYAIASSLETAPLPPFGSKPPFPYEQYRAAWKYVKKHYDKIQRTPSVPTAETWGLSRAPTPAASLLSSEVVLQSEDTTIPTHDVNNPSDNNQTTPKEIMEGESLPRAQESHLSVPTPPKRRNPKQQGDKLSKKKGKRGRPPKNTTDVST